MEMSLRKKAGELYVQGNRQNREVKTKGKNILPKKPPVFTGGCLYYIYI